MTPERSWGKELFLPFVVFGLWVAAGLCLRGATPLGVDAPPEHFSALRAREHLEVFAREPHPVGSPQLAVVREYVHGSFEDVGLQVELQSAGADPPLTNIVARVAGRERESEGPREGPSAGPLYFCAHYDTVPASPGASDDGFGVALLLELARALAHEPPLHDVHFLITDGEELGLLGARSFARANPELVPRMRIVNLEALGNGEPAILFETGAQSGALIREHASVASVPLGSSLAHTIYAQMPNDTDFSAFKIAGARGLNFAMIGGGSAYHAPFDLPENQNARSLQALGESLLALARSSQAGTDEEVTYFDLASSVLVVLSAPLAVALHFVAWAMYVWLAWKTLRANGGREGFGRVSSGLWGFSLISIVVVAVACGAAELLLFVARAGVEAQPVGNMASTLASYLGLAVLVPASLVGLAQRLPNLGAPELVGAFGLCPLALVLSSRLDVAAGVPIALATIVGCGIHLSRGRHPIGSWSLTLLLLALLGSFPLQIFMVGSVSFSIGLIGATGTLALVLVPVLPALLEQPPPRWVLRSSMTLGCGLLVLGACLRALGR